MANTTIFNEINWKLGKCSSPKCSCGDEDNAYHYFFVYTKMSAFRPYKIVLLDIFNDTDSKILKEFISSSKKLEELYPWHFHFDTLLLTRTEDRGTEKDLRN